MYLFKIGDFTMGAQMHSSVKAAQNPFLKPANPGLLQRQCSCGQHAIGGECEECREKKGILQRAAVGPAPNKVPPIVHEVLRSPGQPLDPVARDFMEPRFGHDFSKVRVHIDARAAKSARTINAVAYTIGQNIVFGSNQYEPQNNEGKQLLAHELVHVVQQTSSPIAGSAITSGELHSNHLLDKSEETANQAASLVMNTQAGRLEDKQIHSPLNLGNSPISLQRKVPGPQSQTDIKEQIDPRLLLTGKQAVNAISKILPTAHTIIVPAPPLGHVELRPGAIWDNKKMLVYASPTTVLYAVGDNLYESWTSVFIFAEWLNALGRGAERATGMIYLAKAEMALLEGIFVPWYTALGLIPAKIAVFYIGHRNTVDRALKMAPKVLRLINEFKKRYPSLYKKIRNTLGKEILRDLPSGVTAQDIAFFIGRLICGFLIPKSASKLLCRGNLTEVAWVPIIKLIAKTAILVSAVHLPFIAVHGVEKAARNKATELQKNLAEVGIVLSKEEARTILKELLQHRDTAKKLQDIQTSMQELLPVLKQLEKAFQED
jgi:hypothetical protein